MVIRSVARVQQLEEDSLKENLDYIFQVFAEVCEEAEENGDYE